MCSKNKKTKIIKPIFAVLSIMCAFVFGGIIYMQYTLPNDYSVFEGNKLNIGTNFPVEAVYEGEEFSSITTNKKQSADYSVQLKALGIIPIKKASISVVSKRKVAVSGKPFGIKIYTDGVMVVGIDSVETEHGNKTPATDAGLKEGDLILSINGQAVYSNEEVAELIEKSGGNTMRFLIRRNNKEKNLWITPVCSYQSGTYKTGIWVRDSSAGIGTMTFYSPANGVACGLGHGVCDIDTGELLTLNSGELVAAEIVGIDAGCSGDPGELMGRFCEESIGELVVNNETGVYAACEQEFSNKDLIPLALKQEIKTGKAQIYTTVDGKTPAFYECEIEKIAHNDSITKNMVIRITDSKLLELTGGIVQGMSGSPVIQNGKLVGAVTHVLVDDPTKGYAIFAENMLETAQSVANNVGDGASISHLNEVS